MSFGWVSTCVGSVPGCVGRRLATVSSILAKEGASDAWETGAEAQVRHFSSLGSLPQLHLGRPWSPGLCCLPGLSWNLADEGAPPCLLWHTPGTRCPQGHLADTPGDWGMGQVPTLAGRVLLWADIRAPRPGAVILTMAPPDGRRHKAQRRKEKLCGWVAGFVGLCCGFGWEGG